jgi:chloride channel protein, CIC family
MGAVFAAAARAPITAVLIVFELTGDYNIILPLMFAIVAPGARLLAQTLVAEAMGKPPRPLGVEQPASEIIARFATERSDSLPVTDSSGALLGVVAAVDLERAVTRDCTQIRVAADLMREAPKVRVDETLEDAIAVLAAGDDEGIPVVDSSDRMVGWLTHRRVLRAYRERARRSATPDRTGLDGPTDAERSEAPDYDSTAARARAAFTSADKVATS